MSTVKIEWDDITQIRSSFLYIIGRYSRQSLRGFIRGRCSREIRGDSRGTKEFAGSRLGGYDHQLGQEIWHRFNGAIEFGFSHTKSSSVTQLNLATNIQYQESNWSAILDVVSLVSTSGGEKNADNDTITGTGVRYLGTRWYIFSFGRYQHNLELGLDNVVRLQVLWAGV